MIPSLGSLYLRMKIIALLIALAQIIFYSLRPGELKIESVAPSFFGIRKLCFRLQEKPARLLIHDEQEKVRKV